MFDAKEIQRAVRLQAVAYDVLRWLGDLKAEHSLSFDEDHGRQPIADAASHWLQRNYEGIPRRFRPEPDDLPTVANLVASMLATSFALDATPRQALTSRCGCYCPWCASIGDLPRLRPRKLERRDKVRAGRLLDAAIVDLALEREVLIDDQAVASLRSDPELREATAAVAWARQLLLRCRGEVGDPSTLVLWRGFAWTVDGAPKKRFEVTAELLLGHETALGMAIDVAARR